MGVSRFQTQVFDLGLSLAREWGGAERSGPSPDDRGWYVCVSARPDRSAKPFVSRDDD
jgi:hypothetical protein